MQIDQHHWRLILDPAYEGAANMAIDEAILDSVGRGESLPTLRLYRWEPACLSLGYAQSAGDVDRARLDSRGWQLVRRMSGGRAILHTDEITYSVALPLSHPLVAGSILESYRRISAALMFALTQIGVTVSADKRSATPSKQVGPVCFEIPSHYEITANGKKLIGSAQVRKHNGALQHGSLPLTGDLSRICDALIFDDPAARETARQRVLQRATTLEESLGKSMAWETVAQALIAAFAETFNLSFEESTLTPLELQRVEEFRTTLYANDRWTFKR